MQYNQWSGVGRCLINNSFCRVKYCTVQCGPLLYCSVGGTERRIYMLAGCVIKSVSMYPAPPEEMDNMNTFCAELNICCFAKILSAIDKSSRVKVGVEFQ